MKGFPKIEVIERLKKHHLNISSGRITNIEYIDYELFKKLLKENNIKIDKYEKYWSETQLIGNSKDNP